ncbi:MAG: alpha-1,2-fucosyltransferase [Bacteroidota bacterium]|nr:alpha-1,2-fucosyltransferase [Bacteroidota bacterium]
MIIVAIGGGLGNQLFEYAFGYSLSKKLNTTLKLDLSGFESGNYITKREFTLNRFNINCDLALAEDIMRIKHTHTPKLVKSIYKRIFPYYQQWIVEEKEFGFDPNYLNIPDNRFILGVWHSYKYFDNYKEEILSQIQLREIQKLASKSIFQEITNNPNAVAVHIRRGDYLIQPLYLNRHGLCDISYYKKASEIIESKISNPTYYIFSDDINWAITNLSFLRKNIPVSTLGLADYEELIVMSKCKHHIIANSSFSWWGAYLGQHEKQIVVAPKNWFAGENIDENNLFLPFWESI